MTMKFKHEFWREQPLNQSYNLIQTIYIYSSLYEAGLKSS